MKAAAFTLLVALIAPLGAVSAWACTIPPGAVQVGTLAVTTMPAPIPLGKPFAMQIVPCGAAPEKLVVDAHMPAHKHGMNYQPRVTKAEDGFGVEGLLFHMSGEWEFVFDLRFADGRGERLTHRVIVR